MGLLLHHKCHELSLKMADIEEACFPALEKKAAMGSEDVAFIDRVKEFPCICPRSSLFFQWDRVQNRLFFIEHFVFFLEVDLQTLIIPNR